MKNRLPLLLFLSMLVHANCIYGQFGVNAYQLAPSSSDILSKVEQPVSLNNGTVNINIPLGEIGTERVKVPISINYQTSGILVPNCASGIGLGWALNAGGKITRVVKGLPDDQGQNVSVIQWENSTHTGRFWNQTANKVNNFTPFGAPIDVIRAIAAIKDTVRTSGSVLTNEAADTWMTTGDNDTDPDLFYFSFGDKQGKFVFNRTLSSIGISMIPYQNIKIEPYFDGTGHISFFTVRDEDGSTYQFNTIEQVTDTYFSANNTYPGTSKTSITYTQSWHLTKITDINGEEINFNYANDSYTNFSVPNHVIDGNGVADYGMSKSNSTTNKRLTSITTENASVVFGADSLRQDIIGQSLAIADIIFKQNQANLGYGFFGSTVTRRFHLNYDYFESPNTENFKYFYTYFCPGLTTQDKNTCYKRLKLTGIQEFGSTGAPQQYTFNYNTNHPLPYRFSNSIDFWNFFNGVTTNVDSISMPTIYCYPSLTGSDRFRIFPKSNYSANDTLIKLGANRNPGSDDIMSTGMLTSITYPTGGSAAYEYEADEYYYDGENYRGGGLRIKNIKYYDGISANATNVKSYTYQIGSTGNSSGKIISMPVFAFPMFACSNLSKADRCNNSQIQGGNLNGKNVGYTEVTEHLGTTGGKSVYKYSMPATAGDTADATGDNLYHATTVQGVNADSILWNSYLYPNVSVDNFTLASKHIQLTYDTYPFAPNPDYDWNRGFLLSKTDYNANGLPVHKTQNNYSIWYKFPNTPTYVYGFMNRICTQGNNYDLHAPSGPWAYWIFFSRYYLIADCAKTLSSSTETYYNDGDTTKKVVSSQNFVYGNKFTYPIETAKKVNNTTKDIISYKYVPELDYTNISYSSSPEFQAYKQLSFRNAIAKPIQISSFTEKNGIRYLQGSNLYTYELNNDYPVLKKCFKMSLANVTADTPTLPKNLTPATVGVLSIDNRYVLDQSGDQYSDSGQLLQVTNDLNTTSFIHDSYNALVTAQITNAKCDEVAYCSFENAPYFGGGNSNLGNWQLAAPTNTVSGGFTGAMAYMLVGGGGWTDNTKVHLDSVNGKKYVISFWKKDNTGDVGFNNGSSLTLSFQQGPNVNGWTYYEAVFTATAGGVGFWIGSGAPVIDELRLYPANAQMETFTYNPSVGVTAKCDFRNNVIYYDYDNMGRPCIVKDIHGNIVNKVDYAVQQSE